jgi:PhoH-like ATPase
MHGLFYAVATTTERGFDSGFRTTVYTGPVRSAKELAYDDLIAQMADRVLSLPTSPRLVHRRNHHGGRYNPSRRRLGRGHHRDGSSSERMTSFSQQRPQSPGAAFAIPEPAPDAMQVARRCGSAGTVVWIACVPAGSADSRSRARGLIPGPTPSTGAAMATGLPLAPVTVTDAGKEAIGDRLTVVLDTNVLLSDPDALYAFPNCDIVLPLTVIEELDDKKTRPDDVGYGARASVRALETHRVANGGTLDTPAALADGSTLRVVINGLQLAQLDQYHLPADKADNRIIAAALGLVAEGRRVRIVSMDGSMRIKAAQLGLEAEDYIKPGASRDEVGVGYRTVEVPYYLIEEMYQHKTVDVADLDEDAGIALKELVVNEFGILRAGEQRSVMVRRVVRRGGDQLVLVNRDDVGGLKAKSKEQTFALNLLTDPTVPVVGIDGQAGTGKTILALAAALEQVFKQERYERLMILRPMVAVGRQEMGFLPGDKEEKLGPWFKTVEDTMVAMGRAKTYEDARKQLAVWQQREQIVMDAVTHLRGRSLQNTFVVVDESQNLASSVLKTILTRIGRGSKVVFLGDVTQIDDPYLSARNNALASLAAAFAGEALFGHVSLVKGERSDVADLAARRL